MVFSNRKSTFDMFNFLASQHRQLPDIELYDDEEDDVLLKSTRSASTVPQEPLELYRARALYSRTVLS